MVDRSVELPFRRGSVAETATGKKVVGTYCRGFLIVNNRVVDSFLLEKSISQSHLGIWIVWLHRDRFVTIENCLVHLTFAQKSGAKIVIGIPKVRLHFQCGPVMRNRIVKLASSKKYNAQVVVSHPTTGISGKRRWPGCFDVAIHRSLSPCQCRQQRHHTERRASDQAAAVLKRVGGSHQTGRRPRGRGARPH